MSIVPVPTTMFVEKFLVNGNPIAADASFLEKRRKGLTRFTNALVRHPVLAQEQLVVMFLTVPTVSLAIGIRFCAS